MTEWNCDKNFNNPYTLFGILPTLNDKINTILNFFEYRNNNANAESIIAKIKLFRAHLRGVTDVKSFHFRFEKLFA